MAAADNSPEYLKNLHLQFMSVKSNNADMLNYNIPRDLQINTLNAENKQKNKFLPAYHS